MVRNMQHTDDPDRSMAVIVWAAVGIGLVFLGGWGYVIVHFALKYW